MDSNNSSSTPSTQVALQLGDTMAENEFRNEFMNLSRAQNTLDTTISAHWTLKASQQGL